MLRLRAASLVLALVPACTPSIRADENDADKDKPVVIVAAKDAEGMQVPAATAPTVAPPRSATAPGMKTVAPVSSASSSAVAPESASPTLLPR